MKILRLFFQNLNSLRGRFEIDFEQPPLSDSGLFAITGPTGAGKSTVLDAITLALYGRSSRYGTAPNPPEVMSRHSTECTAEVDFLCAAGRYRSVWKLRRAKGAVDGTIIKERRVIRLPDGEILTQKQDDSNKLITELTGLDYDRLLRSVLLAQGEFAAFLRAKPAQRTELLERITGAAVYSQISMAAFEEAKKTAEAHQKLEDCMREIAVLPEGVRVEKQARLQEIDAEWTRLRQTSEALGARVSAARQYVQYQGDLAQIEGATAQLVTEREGHAAQLTELERHEQAAQWGPELAELDLLQEQQRRGIGELAEAKRKLPGLWSAVQTTEHLAHTAGRLSDQCEHGATRFQALFDEVAGLDQTLAQAEKTLEEQRVQIRQAAGRVQSADATLEGARAQAAQWQTKLDAALAWLGAQQRDAGLAEAWPDMRAQTQEWVGHIRQVKELTDEAEQSRRTGEEQKAQLEAILPSVAKLEQALSAAEADALAKQAESDRILDGKTMEQWEEERSRAEAAGAALQSLLGIAESHQGLTDRLTKLQGEKGDTEKLLAAAHEQVERATQVRDAGAALVEAKRRIRDLALRVQSFEEQRHLLEPGVACPLCGSVEHPFATPHGQPSDEVAAANRELKKSEAAWKNAEGVLQEVIKAQTTHQTTVGGIGAEFTRVTKAHEQCLAKWREGAAAAAFDGPPEDMASLESAVRQAQERREALQRQVRGMRQSLDAAQKAAGWAHAARLTWMGECAKKEKLEGDLQNCRQAWQLAQKRAQEARDAASQTMAILGVTLTAYGETILSQETDAPALQRRIQDRIKAHEQRTKERASAAQELATLQQKQEGLLQQRRLATGDLTAAREREAGILQQQNLLQRMRREKFGDQVVGEERRRLQKVQQAARQERDEARRLSHEAVRGHDAAEKSQEAVSKHLQERQSGIAQSTSSLQASAQQAGFASLDALRQSLMPATEAERRAILRAELKRREQTLAAQSETFEKLRAALPADAAESAPHIPELESQKQAAEASMQALGEQRGALNVELRQDGDRRQGLASLDVELAAAAAEKLRWKALGDLIGSATGGSFSRFAQGLTLERLVGLANRHLHHLNPRYSLRRARGDAEDLELEVVDHYQADAARPMASLSGGESFLASLALALGLSELASGRKAIESLFIDEGFGTLDADTLDAAMAALERVQATGKTIGLISHVESMKERIATQIQITKGVGGWSEVKVV